MPDESPTFGKVLPPALLSEIASQCSGTVLLDLSVLVDALQARLGQSLKAILFYGSCLHNEDLTDAVVDFYAIVDDISVKIFKRATVKVPYEKPPLAVSDER